MAVLCANLVAELPIGTTTRLPTPRGGADMVTDGGLKGSGSFGIALTPRTGRIRPTSAGASPHEQSSVVYLATDPRT